MREELKKKSFGIFDELEMGRIEHLFDDMQRAEDNCVEKEAMDTAAVVAKCFGVLYDSESTKNAFEEIRNNLLNSVPLLVPFGEATLITLEKVEGSRAVWSVTILGISSCCVWDSYRILTTKSKSVVHLHINVLSKSLYGDQKLERYCKSGTQKVNQTPIKKKSLEVIATVVVLDVRKQ